MGLGEKIENVVEKIDESVEKVTNPDYLDNKPKESVTGEQNEQFDPAYATLDPKPGNSDIASFEPAYGGASDKTASTKDCAY